MEEVCRCCAMNCTTLENIFAERERRTDNEPLIVMLEYCTNCEIRELDSLPQNICGPCRLAAKSAFEFKMRCEQSQQYFRELLSECDQKPNIEDLTTGDWCLTESPFKDVCIKQEHNDTVPQDIFEICEVGSMKEELNEDNEESSTTAEETIETRPSKRSKNNLKGTEERLFKCHLCSAKYRRDAYLRKHISQHIGERPDSSTTNSTLKTRISEHKEKNDHKCQYCPMYFSRDIDLKRHFSHVHGQKSFQCLECLKYFTNAINLKLHGKVHSKQTEFKCSHCPKIFGKEFLLKRHIKRVHIDQKPHACPSCNKRFVSVSSLQKHLPQHSDERPYKCDQCPRAFKSSDVLRGHQVMHSDDRPFQCVQCPMAFKLVFHLKRHIKLLHKTENSDSEAA